MTRAQLLKVLSAAVVASWITAAEATAIRDRFDNGETLELPLPPEQAIQPVTIEQAAAAILVVGTLLKVRASAMPTRMAASHATRGLMRDRLQAAFEARARVTATLPLTEWHAIMQALTRDHMLGQYAIGQGRPLIARDIQILQPQVLTQEAYLSRFADERAAKALAGHPLTEEQIAARSELYSGAGRAAWFQGNEARLGAGYVVLYQSRDDGGTCSPCFVAEQRSPYLPGTGAYPGSVCLGRGHCRCVRVDRYDVSAYRRLTGAA